eukprot:Em0015g660a
MTDDLTNRRVQVCCKNLHCCAQVWQEHNGQGIEIASRLVNAILQCHEGSSFGDEAVDSSRAQLEELLEQFCRTLEQIVSISSNLKSVVSLQEARGEDPATPVFHTLPMAAFASCADSMTLDYSQELSLKRNIVGDLLRGQRNRDTLKVYLSCWIHQPYLSNHVVDQLEALLIEAGLRSA